jgi:secreted Zn-dependent insulinase-like peptidase
MYKYDWNDINFYMTEWIWLDLALNGITRQSFILLLLMEQIIQIELKHIYKIYFILHSMVSNIKYKYNVLEARAKLISWLVWPMLIVNEKIVDRVDYTYEYKWMVANENIKYMIMNRANALNFNLFSILEPKILIK